MLININFNILVIFFATKEIKIYVLYYKIFYINIHNFYLKTFLTISDSTKNFNKTFFKEKKRIFTFLIHFKREKNENKK